MRRYRLTKRADADLHAIFVYGEQTFGSALARTYQFGLIDCFEMLARHPNLGRPCPAVSVGLRRHEHGSHVVLYEHQADGIAVVAVVHRRKVPSRLDLD